MVTPRGLVQAGLYPDEFFELPNAHREFLHLWFSGKEKLDGDWSADARWGDKNDPKPRYKVEVKWGGVK